HTIDTPLRLHQALALHHLGRGDEALAVAAAEIQTARRWGAASILARAVRIQATIERSAERLAEAVALATASPARLELARALAAHGAALRADRRPSEARDP